MKCKEIKRKIVPYLDGELGKDESMRVREHLSKCRSCADEAENLNKAWQLFSNLSIPEIPDSFGEIVARRAVLRVERGSELSDKKLSYWLRIGAVLAAAAGIVIGVFLGSGLSKIFNEPSTEGVFKESIFDGIFDEVPQDSPAVILVGLVEGEE